MWQCDCQWKEAFLWQNSMLNSIDVWELSEKTFFWKNLVIVFNVQYNRRKIELKMNDILIDKSYQNKLQSYNSGDDKRVLRIKNGRKKCEILLHTAC